jgi:pimeloyl-ACP methyl ester carboxylesterase
LHRYAVAGAVTIGALAVSALVNRHLANKAERENPPAGKFIEVDGVRLHYVERGEGEPLVLLHGNGSMIQDFETSGLIDMAAKTFRVIVFDRPGFGHSERPRSTIWTADSQIRASAAESALMIPGAFALQESYGDLKMPVVVIAGQDDRLIDIDDQSAELHRDLTQSTFHSVTGAGHMVHQTATKQVMAAIVEAAAQGRYLPSDGRARPLAA